jgi:hypothetical protein
MWLWVQRLLAGLFFLLLQAGSVLVDIEEHQPITFQMELPIKIQTIGFTTRLETKIKNLKRFEIS